MKSNRRSAMAKMMLDWEFCTRRADELADAIKDTVRQIGKSQTVGCVVAALRVDGAVSLILEEDDDDSMVS